MVEVRPTGTLLGSMLCSRSVRGCAARSRLVIPALAARPTTLS
jgi:hypothetical protein